MIVEVDHPAVTGSLKLSYGADGAAGLDGLGRVVDQKWTRVDGETLAVVDRFGYTYDDEGNLVTRTAAGGARREFEWDYRQRLTSVTDYAADDTVVQQVLFTYDALDNRLTKTVDPDGAGEDPAETTTFAYADGHAALEFSGTGGERTLAQRYLYGPGVDQVLARDDGSEGGVFWALADNEGTVRDLVDASGDGVEHLTYDSFGRVTGPAVRETDFRFTYTGRELDAETGLYYYRARYYDSGTGRFLSEDPSGFCAGDPNLYRYVSNNPLVLTDPTGLRANAGSTAPSLYLSYPAAQGHGATDFAGEGLFIDDGRVSETMGVQTAPAPVAQGGSWWDHLKAVGVSILTLPRVFKDEFIGAVDFMVSGGYYIGDAGCTLAAYGVSKEGSYLLDFAARQRGNSALATVEALDKWSSKVERNVKIGYNYGGLSIAAAVGADEAFQVLPITSKIHMWASTGQWTPEMTGGTTTDVGMLALPIVAGELGLMGRLRLPRASSGLALSESELGATRGFGAPSSAGGRLGSQATRAHVADVAAELESRGWTVTRGGGMFPEEYLPGTGGGRLGSNWVDIKAVKNGRTLRINTIDTLADGITPTAREATAAAAIRAKTGGHLLLIPKP